MANPGFTKAFNFGLFIFLLSSAWTWTPGDALQVKLVVQPEGFTKDFNVEEAVAGDWETSFRELIESLRIALADAGGGEPFNLRVLPPQQDPPTRWFHLRLRNNDPRHAITLRIRADNLYLHGYQRAGSDQWLELRTRDGPQAIPGSRPLGFGGSYSNLATAGDRNIDEIDTGRYQLMNAVTTLATSAEPDGQRRARSLFVVILMICESIRFQEIANRFITSTEATRVNERLHRLIRSWGDLSDRLQRPAAYDDNPFPVSLSENFRIRTAQRAAAILGMLLAYKCNTGAGPRGQLSPTTLGEDDGSCPVGRPLMEVTSVIINDIDGEDPGQLYGTINVTDGLGTQSIYSRTGGGYDPISPGYAAQLTYPGRAISALGNVNITLDLWDKDFSLFNSDDQISRGSIYWGDYGIVRKYDQRLDGKVAGQYGSVTVNYIVLSDAVEAKIEVTLVKGGDYYNDDVYGRVVARIFDPEIRSVLFSRKTYNTADVPHGTLIPLSREIVPVPLSSVLRVTAVLYDYDTLSADEEIANGDAYFTPKPSTTSTQAIRGKDGEIEVKVIWNPSHTG